MADNKTKSRKDYLTTTELARLCGVSRFTVINWTNQGKIRAMRTVGKHYRIPVTEAISFYEALHNEKKGVVLGSLGHCWECTQNKGDCLNCGYYKEFFSIYGKRERLEEACDEKSEEATGEKSDFLYCFFYGVGRGLQMVKERVVNLRERFAGRPPRINKQVERRDV